MQNPMEKLAAKLEKEGEKTGEFFRVIQSEQWGVKLYADGQQWSIRQVFTHIVEAEASVPRLISNILGGAEGSPEDFDLDRYNENRVKKADAIKSTDEALLGMFMDRRAATIKMVKGMTEEDFNREGRHPFLGWSRVEDMVKLMYMHVQLHQRDIRKKLNEG